MIADLKTATAENEIQNFEIRLFDYDNVIGMCLHVAGIRVVFRVPNKIARNMSNKLLEAANKASPDLA